MALEIKNLHVYVEDKHIIKGINAKFDDGKVIAIMGPNGSGKTSLGYAIAGHPSYVASGEVIYNSKNILELKPEERAKEGIFLSFQTPPFLEGITIQQLLKKSFIARFNLEEQSMETYRRLNEEINNAINILGLNKDFIKREVNRNFSGGEKKKAEMLQMLILKPNLALIDEIDSGLDVDSLRLVTNAINKLRDNKRIFIVITHYNRILSYIKPDVVLIMKDGMIKKQGDERLAKEIEEIGYAGLDN
ncbi:MAG: Fe-S cluster assembly ATPase SufC [Candidatus Anstonellales archaeon]